MYLIVPPQNYELLIGITIEVYLIVLPQNYDLLIGIAIEMYLIVPPQNYELLIGNTIEMYLAILLCRHTISSAAPGTVADLGFLKGGFHW